MWQWEATAGCLRRVWEKVLQRMRIHSPIQTSTYEHLRLPPLKSFEEGISTELIERVLTLEISAWCPIPHEQETSPNL